MEIILALVAVGIQAVFTGSETALVRANWFRLATWVSENRRGARPARQLLERKEEALITTLVGTALFIVLSSELSERFIIRVLSPGYTLLPVVVVTVVSLFFAEFLPKSIAQTFPESWLCRTELPLRLSGWLFLPLNWLLARLSGVKPAGQQPPSLTRRDFVFALRASARSGGASLRLSGIAARLLDFPQVEIGDVMTPLSRVVAVPEGITYEELRALIRANRYSRYPVFRGTPDNIIGVQNVRDLLEMPHRIVRKPFFVTDRSRAIEVMNQMRERGEHLAFVRGPEEQVLGIVTLEDLLEELVGEIRSEE
jgi:putative hemolysin